MEMPHSEKILEPAFLAAGQTIGTEIWRIQNFKPVALPKSHYGKFYSGDSYIVLHTKSGAGTDHGASMYDIHCWIGKDSSQDEYGTAAMKATELDELFGGRPNQHREIQGEESDQFLSYFKPCIVLLKGGIAAGFNHHEKEIFETKLYICQERNGVVQVKQVPVDLSSLNHDDMFCLVTESKVFEFKGKTANVHEKLKAFEVANHLRDTFHEGKSSHLVVIDDKDCVKDSGADSDEFWGYFGGFAPIATKGTKGSDTILEAQII